MFLRRKNPYIESVYAMAELLVQRSLFVPYYNDFIYRWSPQGRQNLKHIKRVHDKAEETIKTRRQELERQNQRQSGIEERMLARKRRYLDFLDVLLEARVSYVYCKFQNMICPSFSAKDGAVLITFAFQVSFASSCFIWIWLWFCFAYFVFKALLNLASQCYEVKEYNIEVALFLVL